MAVGAAAECRVQSLTQTPCRTHAPPQPRPPGLCCGHAAFGDSTGSCLSFGTGEFCLLQRHHQGSRGRVLGVLLSYADGNGCNPHVPCSRQPESTRVCGCSSLSGGHLSPTCARAAAGPRRVPSGRVLPHYGFLSPIPPWLGNSLSLTMDLTGWRLETNSVTFGLHGTEPSLSLMSPSSGL